MSVARSPIRPEMSDATAIDPQRPPRHLLLVDDEESILLSLRRMLRRDGYVIHLANGGAEGLAVLEREPIGVIVTDQRMPGMSGSEFLVKVRERFPDTVRMVLSGYTELDTITDAINNGAIYKFLTKPWDDELLRGHIAEAFSRYEMKSENARLAALNQAMIDAIPDALLLVDSASAQVINANASAARLLGYGQEAFRGMLVASLEPLPQDQCYWEEVARGPFRPMVGVDTEYLGSDGAWIPVRKTTANAYQGSHHHVLVLVHDLRRERAMESSLERINAEMASIFEATSEGLLVLDSDRCLVRMNRRLHDLWQFPTELLHEGAGPALLTWIAQRAEDPQAVEASFLKHFDDPEQRTCGTLRTPAGMAFRWYASPQLLGDEIAGHVFGFSDLSAPQ